MDRLARSLLLLADPFEHIASFRPELVVPEFKRLEALVESKYFDDAELHLMANLDAHGKASAIVRDWKGKVKWKATHEDLRKRDTPYKCPSAKFELWLFLLKGQPDFSTRSASLTDLRKWLSVRGGVHIYHRGLRVHPYGDPGHDWLDMNLRRVRSPEERPSTNNSIGRVSVEDPQEMLVQKTDRTGFVEADPFQDLRSFAIDALEWLATKRLEERDTGRQQERAEASKSTAKAIEALEKALATVPAKIRTAVRAAVTRYEKAVGREVKALQSEVQLYRTLSTVGTTFAVFAHEVEGPSKRIRKLAESIERRAQEQLGAENYKSTLQASVGSILRSADEIGLFPQLALRLLEKEKRRVGPVRIHEAIQDVVTLFRPFLERYEVDAKLEIAPGEPMILGSVAAIESIVTNLLTNTFNAFDSDALQKRKREVVIRTSVSSNENLVLRVLDSGPGIRGLNVNEIWLPGRTTLPDGTGLGLTIVRDAVTDLGGKTHAIANSELGGAEIIIELPLQGAG